MQSRELVGDQIQLHSEKNLERISPQNYLVRMFQQVATAMFLIPQRLEAPIFSILKQYSKSDFVFL